MDHYSVCVCVCGCVCVCLSLSLSYRDVPSARSLALLIGILPMSRSSICGRVSNAALANAALVLSSKNWKNIQDGGQRRKKNSQKP